MLSKICLYNSKIFVPSFDGKHSYLVAFSYVKGTMNCGKRNFEESFRVKIKLRTSVDISDILLDVVDNYVIGIRSMVVLLKYVTGEISVFMYCDAFENKLLHVNYVEWPFGKISIPSNIFFTHGPTCFLFIDNILQIISLSLSVNINYDLHSIVHEINDMKVHQLKCFGPLFDNPSHLLFILVICNNSASCPQLLFLGLLVNFEQRLVECEMLPYSHFFPKCFEKDLRAVKITKAWDSSNESFCDLKEVNWNENFSVICTVTECLVFHKGMLLCCCALCLPLTDVMYLKTDFSSFSFNNINIILFLENKNAFLITKKENCNQLQLIKSWRNIKNILSGNILMTGEKQLLLLKSDDTATWQDDYILFDILSFIPVDLHEQNVIPNEYLAATLPGLSKRVQTGKLAIATCEQEILQKTAATIDALLKLNNHSLKDEQADFLHLNSFQESLVDIILYKDENHHEYKTDFSRSTHLKLEEYWMKLIDQYWILCGRFSNEGERPICNPVMNILIQNKQLQSIQKVFVHKSSSFPLEDKSKRQINSKEKCTIVIKLEMPPSFQSFQASVTLTWYEGSACEMDNEIFLPEGEKQIIQHQLSFLPDLLFSDYLEQPCDKDMSRPEELLIMRVSQQRIVFCISSLHSNLKNLENILLKSDVHSRNLHMLESSRLKYLVFKDMEPLLFGVHTIINSISSKMIEMEAFTSNNREAFVLVKYLYQKLPDDIVLLPNIYTKNEIQQLRRKAVCAMKEEMDLLAALFDVHNVPDELRKDHLKLVSSCQVGSIIIPKHVFLRIRRVLVKKEYITDSILRYFSNVTSPNK